MPVCPALLPPLISFLIFPFYTLQSGVSHNWLPTPDCSGTK